MDQLPVGPLEKIVDLLSAEAATEDCEAASTPAREGLAGLHGASRHLRKATKQLTFVRVTKLPTVAQPAADFSAFPAVRTLIVHLNSDASCSLAGVEVLAQLRNLTAQAEQRINNARLTFLVERSQLINNARLTFPIDLSTLSQLTRVELLEVQVSVAPLTGLAALKHLDCTWCTLDDLQPVSGLTGLAHLNLCNAAVEQHGDLRFVRGLTQLTLLDIWGVHAEFDTSVVWKLKHLARLECPVADIEMRDLSSLSCLTYLDVGASDIEDMRPFTCLTGLVHLVMYDLNQYSGREVDLRPIASLTQLTNLSAGSVEGFDLSLVHGLSRLAYLMCSDSDVMDLTPISGLVGLEHLDILRCRHVEDLSPISGLTRLTWLSCGCCAVRDLNSIRHLHELRLLNLDGCPVSDVEPLSTLMRLRHLHLSHGGTMHISHVTDLQPLSVLTNLERLDFDSRSVGHVPPALTQLREIRPGLWAYTQNRDDWCENII